MTFDAIKQKIISNGFNSSHSVLVHDDFLYFESSCSWIFAYKRTRRHVQVALEPVIPMFDAKSDDDIVRELDISWREFTAHAGTTSVSFVSVGGRFGSILRRNGFSVLRIGREPWVSLSRWMPSGNSGRGVRSARNQAIRNGVTVREWTIDDIVSDSSKRDVLIELYNGWKSANMIGISGFILATDPLSPVPGRRWFVAMHEGRVEGYVIATRVGMSDRYYLEDLIYDRYAHKGIAELLTTEALSMLEKSGFGSASLGVVLGLHADEILKEELTRSSRFFFRMLSRIIPLFYNSRGQETFRKRFKPEWKDTFLAAYAPSGKLHLREMTRVFRTILSSFRVRVSFSVPSAVFFVRNFLFRYAISVSFGAAMILMFALVNRGGPLPGWAYERFDFSYSLPFFEGVARNLIGNLLYETPERFVIVLAMFFFFSVHAERRWKKRYLLMLLVPCLLLDNYISYFVIYRHFEKINPALFNHIVNAPLFGIEHYIAGLAGMIVWEFRRRKDILLSVLNLLLLLFIIWHAKSVAGLVLDLGVLIFFTMGSLIGRFRSFLNAVKSRKSAKWKPPAVS
jgi:lysylphosphatidylglycerol synthetase-like protein (DUF2156 family)